VLIGEQVLDADPHGGGLPVDEVPAIAPFVLPLLVLGMGDGAIYFEAELVEPVGEIHVGVCSVLPDPRLALGGAEAVAFHALGEAYAAVRDRLPPEDDRDQPGRAAVVLDRAPQRLSGHAVRLMG